MGTLLKKGQIIHGLAITADSIFGTYQRHDHRFGYNPHQALTQNFESSLVLSEDDGRVRHSRITVYHEKITDLVDQKWIYRDWDSPGPFPNDMELVEMGDAIQTQISKLMNSPSDERVVEEVTLPSDGVIGIYLGQWFINPDQDFQRENRVILVLMGDRVVWIPVTE